jgi:hypothetical protein
MTIGGLANTILCAAYKVRKTSSVKLTFNPQYLQLFEYPQVFPIIVKIVNVKVKHYLIRYIY